MYVKLDELMNTGFTRSGCLDNDPNLYKRTQFYVILFPYKRLFSLSCINKKESQSSPSLPNPLTLPSPHSSTLTTIHYIILLCATIYLLYLLYIYMHFNTDRMEERGIRIG